jgi:fatty acid synthase subunit alpha
MLSDIVAETFKSATEQQLTDASIKLECGFATIPLPGIDVPFHSRDLWAGVMPFRACKFLPSTSFILVILTTKPHSFKSQRLADKSRSTRWTICSQPHRGTIRHLEVVRTKNLRPDVSATARKAPGALGLRQLGSAAQRQNLVYIILAYQFASPVDRNPRTLLCRVRVRQIYRDWPRSHSDRHGNTHPQSQRRASRRFSQQQQCNFLFIEEC